MSEQEYHRHSGGDVIRGCAARCIDPDAGAEDVRVLNAAQMDAVLREYRREWASWLENWHGAVGPEPPTIEAIIAALRANWTPFGIAANHGAYR